MNTFHSINSKMILDILPERKPDSHKGDYGKILLICGSRGYTGAAALAAMGALRTGAGLVYLVVPESVYSIVATKLLEPVVIPAPDHAGMLSETAISNIADMLPKMDAVLLGPGIGISSGTRNVAEFIIENSKCPLVLDADGINVISNHIDILRDRTYPTILTPHLGEFARMGGSIAGDPVQNAAQMAERLESIILLKGHNTVITDGLTHYINQTGNPGMATGGSGDVLSGIIVSLLGQHVDPLQAAACGAWLHGSAGDICAREIGQYGMLPQDMIQVLPRLLR